MGIPTVQPRIIGLRPQDVTAVFKDRKDKLAELRELACDQSVKLISVTGRGGIGKTALVCKLCSEIESGLLSPEQAEPAAVDGIIYMDCRKENKPSLERLFYDAGRLAGEPGASQLMSCWHDSSLSLTDKVRFLLGKLRQGFYLLMMDNFEDLLGDDQRLEDEDLRTFVDICLETPHAMRVIATTRRPVSYQGPGMRSARTLSLETGLPVCEGVSLLRDLDPDGRLGLREASDGVLSEAVERCFGVPRALESIAGILQSDPMLSLEDLLADTGLFEGAGR